jgi:DNA-binding beta-propeller fold protein YncE
VAGVCNESLGTNQTSLISPSGIMLIPNGTLYVADYDGKFLAFQPGNRTGYLSTHFHNWTTCVFYDNRTSEVYVSTLSTHLVHILPGHRTIPPKQNSSANCSLYQLFFPTGIAVDSIGNVYIASHECHWITKWAPNATVGVLVAGLFNNTSGSSSTLLSYPYGLLLDESSSMIYVADYGNSRIQRFPLDGSGVGVTVAGGNGPGSAANQLRYPKEIYQSKSTQFIYICDTYNNRIQKWRINATSGVTVVGSSSGLAGRTAYLLDTPFAFTFDPDEKYIYVSDTFNRRVQRFILP